MFLLLKLFDVFECTHLVRFGQPIQASAEAPKPYTRRRIDDAGEVIDQEHCIP